MRSKHIRLFVFTGAGMILLLAGSLFARGREGYLVKPTFKDSGNVMEAFSVTLGTTTPIQVFFSTAAQANNYREIMFENSSTNTYRVYLGTHSAMSATSGGRWFIPGGGSFTTNAHDDLWALYESAAFATGTLDLLIQYDRDSLDENITNR